MDDQRRDLIEDMGRIEATRIALDGIVLLPVGSIEQHGPHLPIGADYFQVEYIARHAARLVRDSIPVVVAPTLPYGCSDHHLMFGATLSLTSDTYYRVLVDIARSIAKWGVSRLFILNGHGGNHELIQLVARDVAQSCQLAVAAASWWDLARDELAELVGDATTPLPGHAGAFETSVLLALRPDIAIDHRSVGPPSASSPSLKGARLEVPGSWKQSGGYTDDPGRADGSAGDRYLYSAVRSVAASMIAFYESSASRSRDSRGDQGDRRDPER